MVEGHVAKAVGVQVPLSALSNQNTIILQKGRHFTKCRPFCIVSHGVFEQDTWAFGSFGGK
jgi:hypothetical protein